MANPAQFAINMAKRAANVPKAAAQITRIGATAALRAAVFATPVDTGRARGAWDVGIGGPGSSGTSLDTSGAGTVASGMGTISRVQKTPVPIYVSNNLEYIGPLENGSSAQAPSGMTTQAINAATAAVRSANIKI